MNRTGRLAVSLMIAGFMAGGAVARANPLSLSISSPFQFGRPGSLLTFNATVANTDPVNTVFLNSDDVTLAGMLVVDDSPFFNFYPLSLGPGGSFTGELFSVAVPVGTPSGVYAGAFEILGGGPSDFSDIAATANFNVDVAPEPSSLVLLFTGLAAGLIGLAARRRGMRGPLGDVLA